jgi:hypothetical protein
VPATDEELSTLPVFTAEEFRKDNPDKTRMFLHFYFSEGVPQMVLCRGLHMSPQTAAALIRSELDSRSPEELLRLRRARMRRCQELALVAIEERLSDPVARAAESLTSLMATAERSEEMELRLMKVVHELPPAPASPPPGDLLRSAGLLSAPAGASIPGTEKKAAAPGENQAPRTADDGPDRDTAGVSVDRLVDRPVEIEKRPAGDCESRDSEAQKVENTGETT